MFENLVKGIIEKATDEYVEIASNDPVVVSEEDGSPRGELLDTILAQQEQERKELYNRLYELEKKRCEKGHNVVFSTPTPANQKELLKLIHMDKQIVAKVEKEMKKLEIHELPDDTLEEIKYKERLEIQTEQLKAAIPVLKQLIEEVKMATERERQIIKESNSIRSALIQNEELLKFEIEEQTLTEDNLRAELVHLQKQYDKDAADMSDFLDNHFPPHIASGAGILGEECNLKDILEKLLNRAYQNPEDPYIQLERSKIWKPYIQTLIKGGIADYHPDDATLICLQNFRLS
ncbi:hypothetical protein BD770DRAFT_331047 [Pilaira anomala]|nr:hypothetical protein BD770DRAFT_331047 [Pilaira anomala]